MANNFSISLTNRATSTVSSDILNFAQTKVARLGNEGELKFYYSEPGGSVLRSIVKRSGLMLMSTALEEGAALINEAMKKKKEDARKNTINPQQIAAQEKEKTYGEIDLGGGNIFYAYDDWGIKCPDSLMLAIDLGTNYITVTQKDKSFSTNKLIWYDVTAIINISSDKNLVITKVQGLDYSRKELISNGDIKFSVSGQITSKYPDIYPAEEVKKFLKIMQYKGVVRVNNELLDQFGITHILITDFNLHSKEGCKSVQEYSFSAIGLQPESEINIETDTLEIIEQRPEIKEDDGKLESAWKQMLNDKLNGVKSTKLPNTRGFQFQNW